MTHWITYEHDADYGSARATCDAPEGADCRLVCDDRNCEGYGKIVRTEAGVQHQHMLYPDGLDMFAASTFSPMHDDGGCVWATWMNEDSHLLMELGSGIVTNTVAVTPVWDGADDPGFKVIEDDGFVTVSAEETDIMIVCSRPACRVVGGFYWIGDIPDSHKPENITRAWYEHLATHVI